jgi:glycosyltransferase involved in cell wall biosynthesis
MKIAVVIPCYRVRAHVTEVIAGIGPYVFGVYVVDDACPEKTGDLVESAIRDPRVRVLRHEVNQGVGGAVITGYRAALADGADVVVKIDGDGQMDPALLPRFVRPIAEGYADYTKGNRFFDIASLRPMPVVRLIGNAGLSFLSKLSTGYWDVFDPTNGYTAIHRGVLAALPFDKISSRYFFESDMLFRLGTLRARVLDIPMRAVYGDEKSSLSVRHAAAEFGIRHLRNLAKRIFYNYFLRNFSFASIELILGFVLLAFGSIFGVLKWMESASSGVTASAGTVMIAGVSLILGLQFLLAFLSFDMNSTPRESVWRLLALDADSEGMSSFNAPVQHKVPSKR